MLQNHAVTFVFVFFFFNFSFYDHIYCSFLYEKDNFYMFVCLMFILYTWIWFTDIKRIVFTFYTDFFFFNTHPKFVLVVYI